jgi:hypothetical protein
VTLGILCSLTPPPPKKTGIYHKVENRTANQFNLATGAPSDLCEKMERHPFQCQKNLKTWHPYDVGFPALSYTLVSQLATKAMIAEIKLYSYGVLAVKEHVTPVKNNINKSQMTRAHDTEVCFFWGTFTE